VRGKGGFSSVTSITNVRQPRAIAIQPKFSRFASAFTPQPIAPRAIGMLNRSQHPIGSRTRTEEAAPIQIPVAATFLGGKL